MQEEQNVMELIELNVSNERLNKEYDNEQIEEMKEIQTVKTTDNNEALTISLNTVNVCCKEKKFLDDLATSWRNILNDSSASDIIIFVKNSRHIWTHKLVFYTRCTNILLDVISNDTEFSTAKEKICWLDTDYDVALAFLEFVYCGVIDKYSKMLDSETSLSDVRALGRKYKINDLFVYLRQKGSKSNVAEIKHDYNTCEKSTGNVHLDIKTVLNVPKLDITLMKSLEEINPRSNTLAKRETSVSPDMFDDTPVMKHNDKSTVYPKDLEDSNIHILLNLIKQDADVNIYSQKLAAKTQNAEYSELDKDIPTCSKNVKQNVMESDIDPKSNSPKFSINNMHQDSLIDIPQSSKSKYIQNRFSEIVKQKSDLTLFIEKIQKENAKLDAALNSDMECSVQISPIRHNNPFHINKLDNSDLHPYDNNVKQSTDMEERPGRLTIIEQRMRSYADKNPEFYSRLSNERIVNVKQTNNSHVDPLSPKKIMESFHNNISNCTQNFTSSNEKCVNISEQDATMSTVSSQHTKTMNQSLNEIIFDLETNEEEISMYSKYMRHHKENSIAKYRTAISRNMLDSNLSNKSTLSDSINEDSDISEAEKNEILTQSVLTQKDADVIVSSDTDVESISSIVSHVVLKNDDFNHEIMSYSQQQSRKETEDNKQDIENENSSQLLVEKFSKAMTSNSEEEKDINSTIKSNRDKLNTTEITSMTQNFRLNELNDQKKESIPSPIMVSSSPDFLDENCSPILNVERLLQNEHCTENVSDTSACKLRKSLEFSLNFEDDIYLGNVDINKYEKQHALEKSQSFNTLSMTKFKNGSTRRCNNKNNHEGNKDNDIAADNYGNLDNNAVSLTQNFTSIRKFQRKSLSEGQIDYVNTDRLCNQGITSMRVSTQFQCNYIQNIGNAKTPKITDKDVTPPPEYNDMSTPELHVSLLTMVNLYN